MEVETMEMFNPSHPGELLREEMGDNLTVTELARKVGVSRTQMSMILNGRAGISAPMSLKLDEMFKKSDGFFYRVQQGYDLAQARQERARSASLAKKGKSTHPDFAAAKVYIRKATHKAAARKWEDTHGGDFSELVETLLKKYVSEASTQNASLRKAS